MWQLSVKSGKIMGSNGLPMLFILFNESLIVLELCRTEFSIM